MPRFRYLLPLLVLAAGISSADVPAQDSAPAGPPALQLSLTDAIRTAFSNNKEIRIDSYVPEFRESDLLFQKAQFDASVTTTAFYEDASQPSLNLTDVGLATAATAITTAVGIDSTQSYVDARYDDRLRVGSQWSAELLLARNTSSSRNVQFPESYYSQLDFTFTQPLLRNFGRAPNETAITVASNNIEADRQTFRTRVQNTLMEVEDAYWTLVFARQDLDVKKEALGLAQELLKLNQIKVQVGTLPPIDITQAEAGVASREEAVIIAEAAIQRAEDRLRRVMGMDPASPEWKSSIFPTQDATLPERQVDLDQEIKTAIDNRTDLESARLSLRNSDVDLAFRRNQMKYSLDVTARYSLAGLAGDTSHIDLRDPNGTIIGFLPPNNEPGVGDAWEFVPKRDFPTYQVQVTLGIPIGNRAAEANYTRSRLAKEQSVIAYENFEQAAIVQVNDAARRVTTDRKRIQAAEKNRVLQEKKVEAEQKKFENGLSTSFQVLEFQKDLAEARSSENRAKADYRISLANLDLVTGVLEKTRNVHVEEYARN